MDSDLGVEHGPDRPVNGVTRRLASTEAADAATSASPPTVGLTDGLRELVAWWRAERELGRRRARPSASRSGARA